VTLPNTKLLFLKANGRKRKKHIQFLHMEEGLGINHEDKAKEIERHFGKMLGKKQPRPISLNWSELDYLTFQHGGNGIRDNTGGNRKGH
jgi:hypothetical protein